MRIRALQGIALSMGCFLLAAGAQAAELTNVQAAQYGSFVYIRYDLLWNEGALAGETVSVQLSRDGGVTFPDPAPTLFGDFGGELSPGLGKYILWDAYRDYPEAYVLEASVRLTLNTEKRDEAELGAGEGAYEAEAWRGAPATAGLGSSAESPLFTLDTRMLTLDTDGDGAPDERFDASQNGVYDVLDDFDGDGGPDAFEDNNGDFIPDAYADSNGNQIADGLEDVNHDGIPDFFAARYALFSPTHPRSDRAYFSAEFQVSWPHYFPDAGGYLWVIDQSEDTIVGPDATRRSATEPRSIDYIAPESGTYYFHLAAVDGDDQLLDASQASFVFHVALDASELVSSTHPEEGGSFSRDFAARAWMNAGTPEWTSAATFSPARAQHTSVVFNNRIWVLGGYGDGGGDYSYVWSSGDGTTWTQAIGAAPWRERRDHSSVVFNNRIWVLGGHDDYASYLNDVWSSEDGVTWTQATGAAPWSARSGHSSVVFNNRIWVLGGFDGSPLNDVWSSADGVTWTQATGAAPWDARSSHSSVVFNDQIWVLGGADSNFDGLNDVWSSPDGVTWTQKTEAAPWNARSSHSNVVFNNRIWVLGGYDDYVDNDVWSSADGVTWTETSGGAPWRARRDHSSVVFNNHLWVLGGNDGGFLNDVWTSVDGETWSLVAEGIPWGPRDLHSSVAFNNRIWILGGFSYVGPYASASNDVWSSTDGTTWTLATGAAPWESRYGHSSVAFKNRIWVLGGDRYYGGDSNDVWSSEDGAMWTQATPAAPWPVRSGHCSVVFHNRIWVLGGGDYNDYHNDVWSSADGVTWTQAAAHAPWSGRLGHTSLVFNNRIWVLGGHNDDGDHNDVWSSPDGVTWTQATAAAPWAGRDGHSSVVFDKRIWVLGGYGNNDDRRNDVWTSADGVTWTPLPERSPWSGRFDHSSVVLNNRIWVAGGERNGSLNDVWSYGKDLWPAGSVSGYRFRVDSAPATLPGASDDYSTTPEFSVSCNTLGEHWLHVVAVDSLGNESPVAHYRFAVLDTAPAVSSPTHPEDNASYGGQDLSFLWTSGGVPGVVQYRYALDHQPATTPDTPVDGEALRFECLDPGTYWFHLQREDACGFLSPVAHHRVVVTVIATPGPSIESSTHPDTSQAYAGRDVALSWTAPEGVHGPYHYIWDRNADTVPGADSPSTAESSLPPFENQTVGQHFLHVKGLNSCGTPSATSHFPVRIREPEAPSPSISYGDSKYHITFTWRDADGFATGTPKFYFAFDAASNTEPGPEHSSTSDTRHEEFNVPDGLHYFHVRSQDTHGNLSPTAHYAVLVGDALVTLRGPSTPVTRTGPVVYEVTYPSNANISLQAGDVTLNSTGTATGTVHIHASAVVQMKEVQISEITGDGTLGISIAAGSAQFPNSVSAPMIGPSTTFLVDNTPPGVTISGPTLPPTDSGPVTYTVTYTGAQTITLGPEDISLLTTGDATGIVTVSGAGDAERTVSILQPSGYGTIGISIAAGTASDTAGNLALASGPSGDFPVAHYTLRMSVYGQGESAPAAGVHTYANGEEVTLVARPQDGAAFLGWQIDGVVNPALQTTIAMTRDHEVRARFSSAVHAADQNGDHVLALTELFRVIQFYNSASYGCLTGTEDGYAPNAAGRNCTAHSNDYHPQDWKVSLSELLRAIQFYTEGGYHTCPDSEDGYCPGL